MVRPSRRLSMILDRPLPAVVVIWTAVLPLLIRARVPIARVRIARGLVPDKASDVPARHPAPREGPR